MAKPKRSLEDAPAIDSGNVNPISEELAAISTGNQTRVNGAKVDRLGFNVDDFYYRANKFHPELTREKVLDAYVNTPVIASDKNMMHTVGAYKFDPDNAYDSTNRVMIYDSVADRYNKPVSEVLSHEIRHAYNHKLYGDKLTDEEQGYLNKAYPKEIFNANEDPYSVNTELRNKISAERGVIEKELDEVLDNESDDYIMNSYFNLNGYTEDKDGTRAKFMKTADGKWDSNKVRNIREALKNVAFAPTNKRSLSKKPSTNLA